MTNREKAKIREAMSLIDAGYPGLAREVIDKMIAADMMGEEPVGLRIESDCYEDVAERFFQRIFNISWTPFNDQTCLSHFFENAEDAESALAKIQKIYNIDATDMVDKPVVELFKMISCFAGNNY